MRTTRENLHRAKSFSFLGLLLALSGSIVGTAVPAFVGAGPGATLVATVVVALLTSLGLTGADGSARGVRAVAALILAAGATAITISGVTVTDLLRGKSLSGETQKTFPIGPGADEALSTGGDPDTGGGSDPDIEITSAVNCGSPDPASAADCGPIFVRSTGTTPLKVTSLEWKGKSVKDFKVHKDGCTKRTLAPGKSCTISVRFTPGGPGSRAAQLVVHQNLPGPASTVNLTGIGSTQPTPLPTDPSAPAPTTTDGAP